MGGGAWPFLVGGSNDRGEILGPFEDKLLRKHYSSVHVLDIHTLKLSLIFLNQ